MTKTYIFTLTEQGAELGLKIRDFLPDSELFINKKLKELYSSSCSKISDTLQKEVSEIWDKAETIIFIMSAGITVRVISRYLKDKTTDPAVIVIDERGKNAISLLSGHIGLCNSKTLLISEYIGANPVITTASDVNNLPAFDEICSKRGWSCLNLKKLKNIAWQIVSREKIFIRSGIRINTADLCAELTEKITVPDKSIIISEKKYKIDCFQIIPKNIIAGIGCRRGTDKPAIQKVLLSVLKKNNIHPEALKAISTIKLKADEPGLINLSKDLKLQFKIQSAEKIKTIENRFSKSEFVHQNTGVYSVSAPCAFLGAEEPELITEKYTENGVTVSLVKDKSVSLNLNEI